MYVSLSLEGPAIIHLPEFLKLDEIDKNKNGVSIFIDKELRPIIMKSGFVYSHAKTDGVRGQYLTTHNYINSWRGAQESDEGHLRYFLQNLVIHKFQACMEAARTCVKFSQ
jgi:WD repeat-containing protein 19